MQGKKTAKPTYLQFLTIFCLLFFLCFTAFAEKISFKNYTTADGLTHDSINKIVSDSRGFLWFCTEDGLSRFDGYRFKNYTQNEGLPHRNINDLLETRDGDYLIATSGGLAVFNPDGKAYNWNILEGKLEQSGNEPPLFKTYFPIDETSGNPSKSIRSLLQDKRGNIYVSEFQGIYRLIKTGDDLEFEKIPFPESKRKRTEFGKLFEDSLGNIWVASSTNVFRILTNGEIETVSDVGASSFFQTQDGKIWVDGGGDETGIRIYSISDNGGKAVLEKSFTKRDGLPKDIFTNAVAQTSDGQIFIKSDDELLKFLPNAQSGEAKFQPLSINSLTTVFQFQNQIWFGFLGKGAGKFSLENFVNFGKDEAVPARISSLFTNSNGEIFLTAGQQLFYLTDKKAENITPNKMPYRSWGAKFLDFQSADGDFWIPTINGLLRYKNVKNFKDLSKISPSKIYTKADGIDSDTIFTVFEDAKGFIWFSTLEGNVLHRLDKATDKIDNFSDENIFPKNTAVFSYGEDFRGNIWFSLYNGDIVRFKDGKFRSMTQENLIPRMSVAQFMSDSKKRLWLITSSRGVFRIDEPDAETPVFTNISTADGLPSNQTFSAVEDNFGRIFIGTGRGIAQFTPETNKIKIYTTSDGLPSNSAVYSLKDKDGNLWFASFNSITKFKPQADKTAAPPPIFIDGISVNGKARNISELGTAEIKNLEFAPEERQIQIGFFAISFESGESLRYQYKLNEQDWSAPTDQRNVSFDLAAGNYDFAVRAINADGAVSEKTANVSFKILPPIWQRWWFLALAFLLVAGAVFALDRYRVAKTRQVEAALEALRKSREERFAELQRVRTRIATDLHDDIGSSLTQIAVLSEVARNQAAVFESENVSMPLERIKGVSRELVETMSDVVWAINPNKDNLRDLVQRMRRFASDVCAGRNIHFELDAPSTEEILPLGANVRREVFAIFKESINNSVKYSECENIAANFRIENDRLFLEIKDDGRGFDTEEILSAEFSPEKGGNGLVNMRRRATELGGNCRIISSVGNGTQIFLEVPLNLSEDEKNAPAQLGGENSNGKRL